MSELQGLQTRYEDFRKAGAEIVAISSSAPEKHRAMGIGFPVLTDANGETIRAYGVDHPDALPFTTIHVARPAELILDDRRLVLKRFITENWRVRERPERLLAELAGP